jgi:hypothetical protein
VEGEEEDDRSATSYTAGLRRLAYSDALFPLSFPPTRVHPVLPLAPVGWVQLGGAGLVLGWPQRQNEMGWGRLGVIFYAGTHSSEQC